MIRRVAAWPRTVKIPMTVRQALPALALALAATPARALHLVLTNDDGLTSNLVAAYTALKADGHDVIVSVPCTGQSGRGAAIAMLSPNTIVADNDRTQIEAEAGCHNGAAPLGAPAVGRFLKEGFTGGDYHYVHGTPVMAAMYALDVLAPGRWGAQPPDLLLSGPNEGQNVGSIVVSSGTVGNTQFAMARGIPAVAISAGTDTVDDATLAHPRSAIVAQHLVRLVRRLQEHRPADGGLLPLGVALNVNVPNAPTAQTPWAFSRQGSSERYRLRFRDEPPYGFTATLEPPAQATATQSLDEAMVSRSSVSISAMQLGYEAPATSQAWLRAWLEPSLLPQKKKRKAATSSPAPAH